MGPSPTPGTHIFQRAGIGFGRSSDLSDLPSWVPDWTANLPGHFLEVKKSTWTRSRWKPVIVFTDDPKVIKVQGVHVDTIMKVSQQWKPEEINISEAHLLSHNFYNHAKAIAESNGQNRYSTTQTFQDAFWRILLCTDTTDDDFSQLNTVELLKAVEVQWDIFQKFVAMPAGQERRELGERYLQMAIDLTPFNSRMGGCCFGKRLLITEKERLGLAPPLVEEGDLVCVFEGLPRPYIIRKKMGLPEPKLQYELVGGCYIDGLMDFTKDFEERMWFTLV